MLFEYLPNRSLKEVLQCSNPPIEPAIKERWAAQIAHGIASIHHAGVVHGDLGCQNIMVDEDNDILIIDISNGFACRDGYYPISDRWCNPSCDVYSLGVVIWELIHDAEELPGIGCELPIDSRGEKYSKSFVSLIEDCHVEFADKRASLSSVIDRLGGSDKCGCHLD
jgi:serine/threonine protein kinase